MDDYEIVKSDGTKIVIEAMTVDVRNGMLILFDKQNRIIIAFADGTWHSIKRIDNED